MTMENLNIKAHTMTPEKKLENGFIGIKKARRPKKSIKQKRDD